MLECSNTHLAIRQAYNYFLLPNYSDRSRRDGEGCPRGYVLQDFVQNDYVFTGHSLGNYSALASIADVLPVSDIAFYREITIQSAVECDRWLKAEPMTSWFTPT